MKSKTYPAISAVLIIKNEQSVLEATLKALRPVVDEIVVADTGSSDASVSIAQRLADRVAHLAWQDDFAAARNAAITHATGDWILAIDADEVVRDPTTARKRLRNFTRHFPTGVVGSIEILSTTRNSTQKGLVRAEIRRFFPRAEFGFTGIVHEQVEPFGGVAQVAATGLVVDHSGYDQDTADPAHKANRNIPLLQKAIRKEPLHHYYHFQLGQAQFTAEAYDDAIQSLSRALELIDFPSGLPPLSEHGEVPRQNLTTLLTSLGYALIFTERLVEARRLVDHHEKLGHIGTQWADFYCLSGYLGMAEADADRTGTAYRRALELGPDREDVAGCGSYIALYHLALMAEADKDARAVTRYYAQALQARPDYSPALNRYIEFVLSHRLEVDPSIVAAACTDAFHEAFWARVRSAAEIGDGHSVRVLDAIYKHMKVSYPHFVQNHALAA